MEEQDVDLITTGTSINLTPGTAWAIYSDDGPGGPCGQCMRITCPHTIFMTWPNEDAMREALKTIKFRNKKHRLMLGVVGDWTSGGIFRVCRDGLSSNS